MSGNWISLAGLEGLIARIMELQTSQIDFESLIEQINTTRNGGKLIFHIFRALAELEWDIIQERTQTGLTAGTVAVCEEGKL